MQTLEKDLLAISEIKKLCVEIASKNKTGHIPSSFSCLEVMYTLYSKIMDVRKDNVNNIYRDKLIVSKEHCKLSLISVLVQQGLLDKKYALEWLQDGGCIGHDIFKESSEDLSKELAAIDVSFGSLGMGIGVGAGIARAIPDKNVYVIVGDGEMQEGSCWEALLFIAQNNLKNVTVILDRNYIQGSDYTKNIIDSSSHLKEQLQAFQFDVIECNGHDINELESAFKLVTQKPKCIIANTIKGLECSSVANTKGFLYFHSGVYNDLEYKNVMEAIQ